MYNILSARMCNMRRRLLDIERKFNLSLKAFYCSIMAAVCFSIPLLVLLIPIAPWAALGILTLLSLSALTIGLYTLHHAARVTKTDKDISEALGEAYPLPSHVSTVKLKRSSTADSVASVDSQGAMIRMKRFDRLVLPERFG